MRFFEASVCSVSSLRSETCISFFLQASNFPKHRRKERLFSFFLFAFRDGSDTANRKGREVYCTAIIYLPTFSNPCRLEFLSVRVCLINGLDDAVCPRPAWIKSTHAYRETVPGQYYESKQHQTSRSCEQAHDFHAQMRFRFLRIGTNGLDKLSWREVK